MRAASGSTGNARIARSFRRIADLLEVEGANPFRVRAYRRAAATVATAGEDLGSLGQTQAGRHYLEDLPGIGPDLAEKIGELRATGRLRLLEELEARTPASLAALLTLPGLGPTRVGRLKRELGIRSTADLSRAVATGALGRLPGFGRVLEAGLARALTGAPARDAWPLAEAQADAEELRTALLNLPGVQTAAVAGSIRRRRPTVGDVDLVVAARPGVNVTAEFVRLPQVAEVLAQGTQRARVRLASGLQADLLVVQPQSYGAALLHFTGSKAHNIGLRRCARDLGLKLNEYGLFQGGRRIAGRTEEEIYAALGLPAPPPTAREHEPRPPALTAIKALVPKGASSAAAGQAQRRTGPRHGGVDDPPNP